jgi:Tfp pilus assembly protein PilF
MRELDASNGWNHAVCAEYIEFFQAMAKTERGASSLYDAGVVAAHCNQRDDAERLFSDALARDSKFSSARADLALMKLEDRKEADIDTAIAELSRAVQDSQYQNVRALVSLARLETKRMSSAADTDGANDVERAEKNLKRALAVDDASAPALNQLALLYYTTAKGEKERLELALLIATQGKKRHPNDAPTHNTLGLIYIALGDPTSAAASFNDARKLDPSFFEAHMNYAAVNLGFRGFAEAESAYRAALRTGPNEYDAHLGLAVALRGQIGDDNFEHQIELVDVEIQTAKKLSPTRPEAYYNDAILTADYKSRLQGKAGQTALVDAKRLYGEFVARAKGNAAFDTQVEDVTAVSTKSDAECMRPGAKDAPGCKKGRIQNIDEMMEFTQKPRR